MCVILQKTTENIMTGIHSYMLIVLFVFMTASVEGIRSYDKYTAIANEFLISKWRLWYKSLDVNHDGKVSMEDAQECENNLSEHLDAEKGKVVQEVLKQRWECIFNGSKGDILEQTFVNALKTKYDADKDEFAKCFNFSFTAVDINKDKSFTKDELQNGIAAYGHQHAARDNINFAAFNPTNGLVPVSVIVDSWVDLVTSTDESKGNVVRFLFEVDGFD